MSEVLARIRVKEEHGIRRFLYPLKTHLPLPYGPELRMNVVDEDGNLLPSQSFWFGPFGKPGVDFALSLSPYQPRDLVVVPAQAVSRVPDPLQDEITQNGYVTRQEKFQTTITGEGQLASVEYDAIQHLAGPLEITLSGASSVSGQHLLSSWSGDLTKQMAWAGEYGISSKPTWFRTDYMLTACKSWVTVRHTLENAPPNSTLDFMLPLNSLDDMPTVDFGIGSGVYSKVGDYRTLWTTDFAKRPYAQWNVATQSQEGARVDYVGTEQTKKGFLSQTWLHWIERTKALAVAITSFPNSCKQVQVIISKDGKVNIIFTLGQKVARVIHFEVCYHFLNDVPAIAAATNPQSILLPPTVEVLAV